MTEVATVAALPPIPMTVRDGLARVTSRDVAATFGKRHDNVLRDIANLECSEAFRRLNFEESSHLNAQNKPQPMVEMTRDGFTFLAMGFTGPLAARFKEAFITAFNAMEAGLRGNAQLPVIQGQIELLVQRQQETDTKVSAILDLVDVTKRYVTLLETNQKNPRRTKPWTRATPETCAEAVALFAEGWTTSEVSVQLDLPRSVVHRIKHGQMPNYGGRHGTRPVGQQAQPA